MPSAVFCSASDETQAADIISRLKTAGFPVSAISILRGDTAAGGRDMGTEKHTKAPEGAATGAGAGGMIGATLGLLAGLGALAIPGVGPLIAAGPIMAALSGMAVGAAVGGVGGTLIGLGIPEFEAKRYETRLAEGGILISVHTLNSEQVDAAKRIYSASGATDIAVASEKAAPEPTRR
ncbi:MAG: hypothetical protein JNM94_08400 [Phycisphaerae bacterium]|nr:hypothetical protein [Phycisphaerae bacterium]